MTANLYIITAMLLFTPRHDRYFNLLAWRSQAISLLEREQAESQVTPGN